MVVWRVWSFRHSIILRTKFDCAHTHWLGIIILLFSLFLLSSVLTDTADTEKFRMCETSWNNATMPWAWDAHARVLLKWIRNYPSTCWVSAFHHFNERVCWIAQTHTHTHNGARTKTKRKVEFERIHGRRVTARLMTLSLCTSLQLSCLAASEVVFFSPFVIELTCIWDRNSRDSIVLRWIVPNRYKNSGLCPSSIATHDEVTAIRKKSGG